MSSLVTVAKSSKPNWVATSAKDKEAVTNWGRNTIQHPENQKKSIVILRSETATSASAYPSLFSSYNTVS